MVGLIVALLLADIRSSTASSGEVLTDAAEVLSLTAERAKQQISISITGVVTAAEPNWDGRFFVQDSSGGVFVNNTNAVQPRSGIWFMYGGSVILGGMRLTSPSLTGQSWAPLPCPRPSRFPWSN